MPVTEKRNLRPYVLGGCFCCGLLVGFIAYSDSQSAANRFDREQQQQEKIDRERREQSEREAAQKQNAPSPDFVSPNSEKVPEISAAAIAPMRLEEEIELVKSPDWKTPPHDGRVLLDARAGLSVFTAMPPLPADRIDAREMLIRFNQQAALPPIASSVNPPNPRSRRDDDLPLPDLE